MQCCSAWWEVTSPIANGNQLKLKKWVSFSLHHDQGVNRPVVFFSSTGNYWNAASFPNPSSYLHFSTFQGETSADISFYFKTLIPRGVFLENLGNTDFIKIELKCEYKFYVNSWMATLTTSRWSQPWVCNFSGFKHQWFPLSQESCWKGHTNLRTEVPVLDSSQGSRHTQRPKPGHPRRMDENQLP